MALMWVRRPGGCCAAVVAAAAVMLVARGEEPPPPPQSASAQWMRLVSTYGECFAECQQRERRTSTSGQQEKVSYCTGTCNEATKPANVEQAIISLIGSSHWRNGSSESYGTPPDAESLQILCIERAQGGVDAMFRIHMWWAAAAEVSGGVLLERSSLSSWTPRQLVSPGRVSALVAPPRVNAGVRYQYLVLAEGHGPGQQRPDILAYWSNWTPDASLDFLTRNMPTPPSGLKLGEFYRTGPNSTTVSTIISWQPSMEYVCTYRIYVLPDANVVGLPYKHISVDMLGADGFRAELADLRYGTAYEVHMRALRGLRESAMSELHFTSITCLRATDNDLALCAPPPPSKLFLADADYESGSFVIRWLPPDLPLVDRAATAGINSSTVGGGVNATAGAASSITGYVVAWRKRFIFTFTHRQPPHYNATVVDADTREFFLTGLHENALYDVKVAARSRGGVGENIAISFNTSRPNIADVVEEDVSNVVAVALPVTAFGLALPILMLMVWKSKLLQRMGCCTSCWFRDKQPNYWTPQQRVGFTRSNSATQGGQHQINPLYSQSELESTLLDPCSSAEYDEYEISYDDLHFEEVIGHGAFGKVMKAQLRSKMNRGNMKHLTNRRQVVAVKLLKEFASDEDRRSLLEEISMMKQLGEHVNVVSMLACVTRGDNICLVVQHCPRGDLHTYLRDVALKHLPLLNSVRVEKRSDADDIDGDGQRVASSSDQLPLDSSCCKTSRSMTTATDNEPLIKSPVSEDILLSYAYQIANGMAYLSKKKFIHRDLAARNVLICDDRLVKISDFGLTRDVYIESMYRKNTSGKLPIKWMAPESIFHQLYTTKSDVWSYGILIWEIVTLGGVPYPGISICDLFDMLKEGYRMPKPDNCSDIIYNIMMACWATDPNMRPRFQELAVQFGRLLSSVGCGEDYLELNRTCQRTAHRDKASHRFAGKHSGGGKQQPIVYSEVVSTSDHQHQQESCSAEESSSTKRQRPEHWNSCLALVSIPDDGRANPGAAAAAARRKPSAAGEDVGMTRGIAVKDTGRSLQDLYLEPLVHS